MRVKKCTPSLLSQCCWSINMHTADKEKPLPHKLCRFTSSLHALLVQHFLVNFFNIMVWYGPTSETAWMQRKQKNWLKYTDFTDLKKITIKIYSNCSNWSLFFKSFNFCCCSLCFIKKCTVNCTSVLHILLLIYSSFFKGKEEWDFWWVLLVCIKWAFLKHPCVFCLGPIASTLKIIMDL